MDQEITIPKTKSASKSFTAPVNDSSVVKLFDLDDFYDFRIPYPIS